MRIHRVVDGIHLPKISEQLFKCTMWITGAIVAATLGYCLLEGWTIQDAFFMTIITFSTVGYGETHELTSIGRVYTALLIFMSIVLMACWTAGITTTYVSGELSGRFRDRRIKKMIQSLQGHTIIVGAGIMAESIIDRLERESQHWVLIEESEAKIENLRKRFPEGLIIESSPKNELALSDANVFAAKTVISVLDSEFDNLLVAMTVKELNQDITVVARTDDPRVASRMVKAGVDEVICPFQLSGHHIADLVCV